MKKQISAGIVSALLAATGVVVAQAPAFASVCEAQLTYYGNSGTLYNATDAWRCSSVQIKDHAYLGGGIYHDYTGPMSSSSSYLNMSVNSSAWSGHADPGTGWTDYKTGTSGTWLVFS